MMKLMSPFFLIFRIVNVLPIVSNLFIGNGQLLIKNNRVLLRMS